MRNGSECHHVTHGLLHNDGGYVFIGKRERPQSVSVEVLL